MKQTTHTILMIEPVAFGFNDQTAVNNYFQQKEVVPGFDIQQAALREFNGMVQTLQLKGIDVLVAKDTLVPHTPDSIFPNNWISFHEDGKIALYPMYAENRRAERRNDIIDLVSASGFKVSRVVDYSSYENQHVFLEGTGSLILDRVNRIAYAALSGRTDKNLFLQFCKDFNYTAVPFVANQTVDGNRLPIYHTNVMMCIANTFAVVCLNTIDDPEERNTVVSAITRSGKEIVEITEAQMHCFAGNMLQVENKAGVPFLVMSQSAYTSLHASQIDRLALFNEIVPIAISTIEKYGGGSVRCMMAEVFL
jgi:Uncharacterized protein conserved in bacteria containing a pentein-type domain